MVVGPCYYIPITHIPYLHCPKPTVWRLSEQPHTDENALLPVRYSLLGIRLTGVHAGINPE
jgi:hypothetical protein